MRILKKSLFLLMFIMLLVCASSCQVAENLYPDNNFNAAPALTSVPVVITATPVPTATPVVSTATPVPTATPVVITATPVPTATPVVITATPVPTATPVVITATPVPIATPIIIPITPVPTYTPVIITATPTPTHTHNFGAENLAKIKKELSKTNVGNEIIPNIGGKKTWDLYNYIDITHVDDYTLFSCLKDFFVNCIAHSIDISFDYNGVPEVRLGQVLDSAVCPICDKLVMTYKTDHTDKMRNLMNQISDVRYVNQILLTFLNEHTMRNTENSNERLTIVCPGH